LEIDPAKIRLITGEKYDEDCTYDGRHLFGPAIAIASLSGEPYDVGKDPNLREQLEKLEIKQPRIEGNRILEAMVLSVEHYGNVVLNIRKEDLHGLNHLGVRFYGTEFPYGKAYSDGVRNQNGLVAVIDSSGTLELAQFQGNLIQWLESQRPEIEIKSGSVVKELEVILQ